MSYFSGQTLMHKKKRFLARLAVTEDDGTFHWGLGADTAFIDEKGRKFTDKLSNFTHVQDEWGRPYAEQPKKGEFVDMSAKKYAVSKQKLAAMRKKAIGELMDTFIRFEGEVLALLKSRTKEDPSGHRHYSQPYAAYNGMYVRFYIGSKYSGNDYLNFKYWFLERRKAKVLFYRKGFDGKDYPAAYEFRHGGKKWVAVTQHDEFIEQP